jgi:hypothetical protein
VGERRGDALRDVARNEGLWESEVGVIEAAASTYAEFQSTHDLHELARAVGNILEERP